MSMLGFHTGLKAQLAADAGLIAWASTHFRSALTFIDGNVPVDTVRTNELPALVMELGDGDSEPEVSNHSQGAETEITCALVWHEDDRDKAFAQRLALPDLAIKAVMANHTLSGQVAGAYVSRWEPDRAANHPTHVWRFTVSADFTVKNT